MPSSPRVIAFRPSQQFQTNVTEFSQRVATSISALGAWGGSLLLVRSSSSRLEGMMILPEAAMDAKAHITMATAYGSRAEEVSREHLDELASIMQTGHMMQLVHRDTDAFSTATQAGADPNEMARLMSTMLSETGQWIRVDFRPRSSSEASRWSRWMAHNRPGVGTHHTNRSTVVAASFTAGAADRRTGESLLRSFASAMPGFDASYQVREIPRTGPTAPALIPGIVLTAAGALRGLWIEPLRSALEGVLVVPARTWEGIGVLALMLGSVLLVLGVIGALGLPWNPRKRVGSAVTSFSMRTPMRSPMRVRPPRQARTEIRRTTDSEGNPRSHEVNHAAFRGDYPFHRSVFPVGADLFASLASPHGSASSGEVTATSTGTPPALMENTGPLIGTNGSDPVRIPPEALRLGLAMNGTAGSGKSVLIRMLYGWSCMERVSPSGLPHHPGPKNTLIALESKGEGAVKYVKWARKLGDSVFLCDLTDTTTPAIDVFDVGGGIFAKASYATSMMVYIYGEEGVGARSREILDSVFPAAFLLDHELISSRLKPDAQPEEQTDAMGLPTRRRRSAAAAEGGVSEQIERVLMNPNLSAMSYAHLLLGADGQETSQVLQALVKAHADDHPQDEEAVGAWDRLKVLTKAATPSAFATATDAPRNKVKDFAVNLHPWFTPARSAGSWDTILRRHANVVVNIGSPLDTSHQAVDPHTTKVLGSMLTFSLWQSVQRNCSGWEEQGRYVSFFTDELAMLEGHSGEIIQQMKDQGRAYGLRPMVAFQRGTQLGEKTRASINDYAALLTATQNDVASARATAEQMGVETEDIRQLPMYHAYLSTSAGGVRQRTTLVKIGYYEDDIASFPKAQRR